MYTASRRSAGSRPRSAPWLRRARGRAGWPVTRARRGCHPARAAAARATLCAPPWRARRLLRLATPRLRPDPERGPARRTPRPSGPVARGVPSRLPPRPRDELGPHVVHFGRQLGEVAVVAHEEVADRPPFLVGRLGLDAGERVVARHSTGREPFEPHIERSLHDHDEFVLALAEVRLDEHGHVENDDR